MWLFGFYHLWMLFLFNHGHFNSSSNPFPSLKTNLWMNIKYMIQEMYVYFTDIRWAVLIEMKSGYPIGVSFRPLLHSYGRIPALSESLKLLSCSYTWKWFFRLKSKLHSVWLFRHIYSLGNSSLDKLKSIREDM